MALSFSTDRHSSVIWSWEALVKDIPLAEPPLMLVKTFLTSVVATAGPTRKLLPYSDVIDTTINILDDVWPGPLLQGEVWIRGLVIPTVRVPHRSAGSPFVPGMWVHGQLSPSDAAGFFPRGDASTIHGRSAGSLPDPRVPVLPGRDVPGGRGGGEELASGDCVQVGAGLTDIAIGIGGVVRCVLIGVNLRQLAGEHFVVGNFDKICPVTLLHDTVILVKVFGIIWTKVGEVVCAQQAADVPYVLTRVFHFKFLERL